MFRKFVLPALGLMVLPAFASAQFEAGNWELALNGGGQIDNSTTSDTIGVTVEVGYFVSKELELGLRQSLVHSSRQDAKNDFAVSQDDNGILQSVSRQDGEGWTGVSTGAVDYHFDLGRFQPFVGAFFGYSYTNQDQFQVNPDGTESKIHSSSWIGGPEAGLKYFVNGTTFVFGRTGYTYWFEDQDMSYFTVDFGIGFRF